MAAHLNRCSHTMGVRSYPSCVCVRADISCVCVCVNDGVCAWKCACVRMGVRGRECVEVCAWANDCVGGSVRMWVRCMLAAHLNRCSHTMGVRSYPSCVCMRARVCMCVFACAYVCVCGMCVRVCVGEWVKGSVEVCESCACGSVRQ